MSTFRHDYRVFEVNKMIGCQFEVILITLPDGDDDRRRPDRISTGQCMGKLRLIVDLGRVDEFPVGKRFAVVLQPLEQQQQTKESEGTNDAA